MRYCVFACSAITLPIVRKSTHVQGVFFTPINKNRVVTNHFYQGYLHLAFMLEAPETPRAKTSPCVSHCQSARPETRSHVIDLAPVRATAFLAQTVLERCRSHTTIFTILRAFEGRPERVFGEAFIGLCIDGALGNVQIYNIVTGGGVRLGPLSCDKRGLVTSELGMLSRPQFVHLQAQINGYSFRDSLFSWPWPY